MTDVEFFFDPVCPWAWITSRWVEEVAAQRDLHVDWRFICLRIVNKERDYRSDFPERYIAGHGTGQKLLRVAAAIRESEGREAVGPYYTRIGTDLHVDGRRDEITAKWEDGFPDYLSEIGVSPELAQAANDEQWDKVLEEETEEALSRVGRDVGTPIITFGGDARASFFGPVISRIPRGEEAVQLWDAVELVATTPGMAELKRSLRERPQTS
jgi:2-hydroxychromene-2-carboxylate isomerase